MRLVRATAAVSRAGKLWFQRTTMKTKKETWQLAAGDISEAELRLFKLAQGDVYSKEIQSLKEGKLVGKKSSIWKLSPILVDGMLRLDGRIRRAEIPLEQKFPVILPPRHYITDLIIDHEHRNCAHQGRETVLCNLRKRFWIPDGRHAVMRSWGRCQVCRLRKLKPVLPRMGELPEIRLKSGQPPFTVTGLDFFGPLEVTVGRRHEKRWGALFCCMVTRAVHVEVAHGLSADETMLAISSFLDTRGRPQTIISDNGTNFVGASRELKEAVKNLDFDKIMGFEKFHGIEWLFIPPGAPHMGGAWERLVQSVKRCLGVVLRNKYPKDTTLLTAIKAAENIVNSRPLTHTSSDPADLEPITPNHLLRGCSDVGPGIPAEVGERDEVLRVQWRRAQVLANQFWLRWTREYLPKLLRREKWEEPSNPLSVGDLVYMVDESKPRNVWIRGYISRIFPGEDRQVRVVEVTAVDSTTGRKLVYKRPVAKVCPLGLKIKIQDPC